MYAAERVFLIQGSIVDKSFGFGLSGIFIDPSPQPCLIVEQQVAGGDALACQQCRIVSAVQMVFVQSFQVGIGENIDVVYQERFVALKEWFRLFDASSRVEQQVAFVADVNGQSEVLVGFQKVDDLFSEMMYIDDQLVESRLFSFRMTCSSIGRPATGTSAFG